MSTAQWKLPSILYRQILVKNLKSQVEGPSKPELWRAVGRAVFLLFPQRAMRGKLCNKEYRSHRTSIGPIPPFTSVSILSMLRPMDDRADAPLLVSLRRWARTTARQRRRSRSDCPSTRRTCSTHRLRRRPSCWPSRGSSTTATAGPSSAKSSSRDTTWSKSRYERWARLNFWFRLVCFFVCHCTIWTRPVVVNRSFCFYFSSGRITATVHWLQYVRLFFVPL